MSHFIDTDFPMIYLIHWMLFCHFNPFKGRLAWNRLKSFILITSKILRSIYWVRFYKVATRSWISWILWIVREFFWFLNCSWKVIFVADAHKVYSFMKSSSLDKKSYVWVLNNIWLKLVGYKATYKWCAISD